MLESIKSNSFIRRVILGSIVILLMLIASWGVFQNYKLEKIYADKAEVFLMTMKSIKNTEKTFLINMAILMKL